MSDKRRKSIAQKLVDDYGVGNRKKFKTPEKELFESTDSDPYVDLGNAIVARAYRDYILLAFAPHGLITTKNGKIVRTTHEASDKLPLSVNEKEIKMFLDSPLYSAITDVDGEAILRLAGKEIEIIKEALKEGMDWDTFATVNNGRLINVDKTDYNWIRKKYRQRCGLEVMVSKFEQFASVYPDIYDSEKQTYIVQSVSTKMHGQKDMIYISPRHKMAMYKYDPDLKKFYCIYRNTSGVLKRRSYL